MSDDKKEPDYKHGYPFDWFNPNNTEWDGNPYPWWFGDRRHFRPWYDSDSDYNTNAKSYYAYLGFRQRYLQKLAEKVNKLLRRDVKVTDTNTVHFVKTGDWQKGDDIITLSNNVRISQALKNAITAKNDGIYSIDYTQEIHDLQNKVKDLQDQIDRLNKKVDDNYNDLIKKYNDLVDKYNDLLNKYNNLANSDQQLKDALNKIINRLEGQGAWSGGLGGNFAPNQSIATGNINVYGIGRNSGKLLKTHSDDWDGDIIQGLD